MFYEVYYVTCIANYDANKHALFKANGYPSIFFHHFYKGEQIS